MVKNSLKLLLGLLLYSIDRKNREWSYQGLIGLFCATGGRSNYLFTKVFNLFHPFKSGNNPRSLVFEEANLDPVEEVVRNLRSKGYHVLNARLPEELIQSFHDYVARTPAEIRQADGESKIKRAEIFSPENIRGVRYEYQRNHLFKEAFVKGLAFDPYVREIAGRFLGSPPVLDLSEMWWHAKYKEQPDVNAAQLYHFDMDRIKWLKVFIYLTDVGEENGPHCFVEGSNRVGGIPKAILKEGYARISDQEVERLCGKDKIVRFVAPRGTIIFEDTSGLHKGEMVKAGARLIFELQYSLNMFGAPQSGGLNFKL